MPQQRSRTRAVIPGKSILGKEGAAAAERKTMGGAVVPGRAVLGNLADQEAARAVEARKGGSTLDVNATKGPAPKAPAVVAETGLPPLKGPRAAASARKAAPPPPSMSEGEAVLALETDPESWEHILDLEAERADGMRPAVAAAIVRIANKVVENPIPEDALKSLSILAGDLAPAPIDPAAAPDAPPAAV